MITKRALDGVLRIVYNTRMRDCVVTVRMTSEARQRLQRLQKHYEMSASGVLRLLVKREDEALGPPVVVKKKARK